MTATSAAVGSPTADGETSYWPNCVGTPPQCQVSGIAAGMHVMLRLGSGYDEDEVIDNAARRGLALEGLGEYSPTDDPRPAALVIGYGGPPAHAYTAAVARLTAVLSEG
jgi:GntR family transcriptional regulator / MocR family aminotransferase